MRNLIQDLRFGLRSLAKNPGFTAVAVLTLALAIGANTAIFSFIDALLLKPLPYRNPERIVRVMERGMSGGTNTVSPLNYLDWRDQNTVFEYMAAQGIGSAVLTGSGEPVQLRGSRVGAHYFDIFGIRPALGRTFAADEDREGKSEVAVISHRLWETQFGTDPAVIGRKILLDGAPHTVIGVLPAGSAFDRGTSQIWRPLVFAPGDMTRGFHSLMTYALLKPGVTLEQARAEMSAIGSRLSAAYPDTNKGWGIAVDRMADVIVGPGLHRSAWIVGAAVAMILLIGCANLANLLLARGTSREREVALRASLGAGRWRLIRQFLTESVLLSLAGGVLGLGVGYAGMNALSAAIPPFTLPRETNVALDLRVLLFALAVSVLTGVLFGLAPALQAARQDLASALKEGGRGLASGSRRRLRNALVVAEVALAFMLLTGAGLLLRSFQHLRHVDPGFDGSSMLTMGVRITPRRIPEPDALNNHLRAIGQRLEALPGVRGVAFSSALPLEGWTYGMLFQVAGRPYQERSQRRGCFFKMVSPGYFSTFGIRLLRGRGLTPRDTHGAPPVAVINQSLAAEVFPGEDPIGQRMLIPEIRPNATTLGTDVPWQIVGIIADEKVEGLSDDHRTGIYVSNEQSPNYSMWLALRTAGDPLASADAIRTAIHQVDEDQPLNDVRTMDQIRAESLAGDGLQTTLLGIFGSIAMLLSAIGIYGVIAFSVAQRTHEIGIRAALGASRGSVLGLVLRGGMTLTAIGMAIGLAGSLVLTGFVGKYLYGVPARDPVALLAATVVLGLAALAACWIPARRAAAVDPLVALRYE